MVEIFVALYLVVAYLFNIWLVKNNPPPCKSEWERAGNFFEFIILAPISFPLILLLFFYVWVMDA